MKPSSAAELIAVLAHTQQVEGNLGAGTLVVALHEGADVDELIEPMGGYGPELAEHFLREALLWLQDITTLERAVDPNFSFEERLNALDARLGEWR